MLGTGHLGGFCVGLLLDARRSAVVGGGTRGLVVLGTGHLGGFCVGLFLERCHDSVIVIAIHHGVQIIELFFLVGAKDLQIALVFVLFGIPDERVVKHDGSPSNTFAIVVVILLLVQDGAELLGPSVILTGVGR